MTTIDDSAALAMFEEGNPNNFARVDMTALNELRMLVRTIDTAKEGIAELVEQARADGHSWSYIGRTLGISRQAAHRRFGKVGAN